MSSLCTVECVMPYWVPNPNLLNFCGASGVRAGKKGEGKKPKIEK